METNLSTVFKRFLIFFYMRIILVLPGTMVAASYNLQGESEGIRYPSDGHATKTSYIDIRTLCEVH